MVPGIPCICCFKLITIKSVCYNSLLLCCIIISVNAVTRYPMIYIYTNIFKAELIQCIVFGPLAFMFIKLALGDCEISLDRHICTATV